MKIGAEWIKTGLEMEYTKRKTGINIDYAHPRDYIKTLLREKIQYY